jgi:hypothetical protein
LATPRQLDDLDVGQHTAEGRAADSECFRCLAACVGEPLDAAGLAHDRARRSGSRELRGRPGCLGCRSWLVAATRFLGAPLLSATRHEYSVHTCWDVFAPGCICVSLPIAGPSAEGSEVVWV